MKKDRTGLLYLLGLAALIVLVAALRFDLFMDALETSLRQLRRGPAVQLKLLGEAVLFGSFLLLTLRVVPARLRPRYDAVVFGSMLVLGWLAEAWGTRTGLWSYYTGETPPLWIVPAWSLGALVIDRMSERTREAFGSRAGTRALRAFYWTAAGAAIVYMVLFSRPAWGEPSTWCVIAALSAALLFRPDPGRDAWVLGAGMIYVFFADFWGTTNHCWHYYVHAKGSLGRLFLGVGFGMFFDSALILTSLRLARLAEGRHGRR